METELKYLEIKNWDKYQAETTFAWIKDYVNKEGDLQFTKLTAYQRYLYDGLCRLRGRMAQRLPNDHLYIATALQLVKSDRPHVAKGLQALQAYGFLIPTSEQIQKDVPGQRDARGADGQHAASAWHAQDTHTDSSRNPRNALRDAAQHARSPEAASNQQLGKQNRADLDSDSDLDKDTEQTAIATSIDSTSKTASSINKTKAKATTSAAHDKASEVSASGKPIDREAAAAAPSHAPWFATTWMALMKVNEHWNGNRPRNWHKLLTEDFETLLATRDEEVLQNLLVYTQFAPGQSRINPTTINLLKNAGLIEEMMRSFRKRRPDNWARYLEEFNRIAFPEEFSPESDDPASDDFYDQAIAESERQQEAIWDAEIDNADDEESEADMEQGSLDEAERRRVNA